MLICTRGNFNQSLLDTLTLSQLSCNEKIMLMIIILLLMVLVTVTAYNADEDEREDIHRAVADHLHVR